MKILKGFLYFIAVIAISLLVYYAYLGGFNSVKVVETTVGPYQLVQVERWGNYNETPKVLDSLSKALKEHGIVAKKAIGIYYDNPKTTTKKPTEYHSIIGFILPDNIDSLKFKELKRAKFNLNKMGATPSTVVLFPKKSTLSVLMAIFKAYPALTKYRKEKNYKDVPSFEIYDDNEIIYGMEIKEIEAK